MFLWGDRMIFGLLFFIQWIFIKLEYIEGKKWRRVEDLNLWWLVTTNGFQPFTIDLSDNSPHEMVLILSIFSFLAERVGFEPT